jgi:hypothetical protein
MIASNIAQRPDSLFPDFFGRGHQNPHEDWDGATLDDEACVLCCARGDLQVPHLMQVILCSTHNKII